jgi:protein-L-isoaspartate(D-aspartate) O-methyltransferase
MTDWDAERQRMVAEQLRGRDIRSQAVLDAMGRVPRHRFVPADEQAGSYTDFPLPIGFGQTISQPYIVAFMTEALEVGPAHKVLEIGTGSGYQAAVLGELAGEVFTIEIVDALAARSRDLLAELGYRNVHVRSGNGYLGWPEEAPFDRIIVTAAPDQIPPALVEQLEIDGLMAVPVGVGDQTLQVLRRTETGLVLLKQLPVRFVPMVGKPKE